MLDFSTQEAFEAESDASPIQPEHIPVGRLFDNKYIFHVPKYQRGYAWGQEQVEDYIHDINKCFDAREGGSRRHHFFGGIVSVKQDVPGAPHLNQYELVDGQQRIATTVMLMSQVISRYKDIYQSEDLDDEDEEIVENRFEELRNQYLTFKKEIRRRIKHIDLLTLSRKDKIFYRDLVNRKDPTPEKDKFGDPIESHRRLIMAHEVISNWMEGIVSDTDSVDEKISSLKQVSNIVDEDLTVIHVVTYNRREAYRLFQVLNDRGISLTEGDLLRASTLEVLDDGFEEHQENIEQIWDNVLIDHPSDTEDFLRWIYASHEGVRPGATTLFEDFRDEFYPQYDSSPLTVDDADQIVSTTKTVRTEFERCRDLIRGNWPFDRLDSDLNEWHKDKLDLLLDKLGHTNCIALLLAACNLDQRDFYKIVDVTERFFFRYKIICNQHIGSLNSRYRKHAEQIRSDPESYDVDSYIEDLRDLQENKATDNVFSSTFLEKMTYNPGASNKNIRYLLLSIEFYWRWYNDGAEGSPHPSSYTRRVDFSTTTIEHIYPRNPSDEDVDEEMEEVKNTLGNLTILGEGDNELVENATFAEKVGMFSDSTMLMNQGIAEKDDWSRQVILDRSEVLKNMAMSIFKM